MNPTIFDLETNGISDFLNLSDLKVIHCLVINHSGETQVYTGDNVKRGLQHLAMQDLIVGHNCIAFDIPAIQKLYPEWKPGGLVRDSMIMARLAWSNQRERDFAIDDFPKRLIGSHSLEAWGIRLGERKGSYEGDWDEVNEDLIKYCVQDTRVTRKLYLAAEKRLGDCEAVTIEHEFGEILSQQERHGFSFNLEAASALYADLSGQRAKLKKELSTLYPPQIQYMKTPEYWLSEDGKKFRTKKLARESGYITLTRGPRRTKEVSFNPDSRLQISRFLMEKFNWKPELFTPSGQPQVDETILKSLNLEEADKLVTYLTLSKRIGQLAEGNEAWLKLEKNSRLHGRVNGNGTVTGRCTHSRPNMSTVPAVSAPWGKECRALFQAGSGKQLVGVDASGLELRCLAHYLAKYDKGEYADIIINGDIHTANQRAAGLESRDQAKTLIYALIYGAGPQRIGAIIGGGRREGKHLADRFLARIPAFKRLKNDVVAKAVESG